MQKLRSLYLIDVLNGGRWHAHCCLFVSVRSLLRVKSGGHWSESPSHWLFLYVKPCNVALQRYHETYFTSWLIPPGEIRLCLRGLPRHTHVPSFGIYIELEIIHLSPLPKLSAAWLELHEYHPASMNTIHTVVFFFFLFLHVVANASATPVGAVN